MTSGARQDGRIPVQIACCANPWPSRLLSCGVSAAGFPHGGDGSHLTDVTDILRVALAMAEHLVPRDSDSERQAMLDMPPQPARPNSPSGSHPLARRRGRRRRVDRAPSLIGWLSSDAEEIERRRWRGRTEIGRIEALEPDATYFGSFRVPSTSGGSYEVEIRSIDQPLNSCGCPDHRVNGLGTCKHIEGVLARLRLRGVRAFAAAQRAKSPRAELFVSRCGDPVPRLLWPADPAAATAARTTLAPFLSADGSLASIAPERVAALVHALSGADPSVRLQLRVSRHLAPWLADGQRRAARADTRARFLGEVAAGRQTIDVLRHPLLPYQREGTLHLAFGERALLADDMGLGKTIQAIAAAELLRRLNGIARVLVVCPASLKGEWQEQIARFSGAATLLVTGPRHARLAQYARPGFFTVVNYEQVVMDAVDINRMLRPEIIILDEAQRIKNWQTKTARAVKSLASPYAFGTNRHADRESHRRNLLDRAVPRSRSAGSAIPLQPLLLRP